jgi:EpsI family protein
VRIHPIRYGILLALLVVSALLSMGHLLLLKGQERGIDLAGLIPMRLGAWQGEDLTVTEGTRRFLGAKSVLLRRYRHPKEGTVVLCITFTGGSHRITHPAEVCYEGQGWTIHHNENQVFKFPGTPPVEKEVNLLKVSDAHKALDVIVWYKTPTFEGASYLRQKFEMLLKPLLGGERWSAMIRLSCEVSPNAPGRSMDTLARFGQRLLPHLDAITGKANGP